MPLASLLIAGSVAVAALVGPPAVAQDRTEPGPAGAGTIAYVRDREEIRLVEPDGSNDRVIFRIPDDAAYGIEQVAWRPDRSELAFASGHEGSCSIWQSDLYLVRPDGSDVRRLTNGPVCAALAGLPGGTISVEVENRLSEVSELAIHVQGLEQARGITLEAGHRATFEIEGVRDLGEDTPQFVVVSSGSLRWFDPGVYADVRPGEVTAAGTLVLGEDAYDTWGALTVSWSHDGSRVGYQQGLGSLWQIRSDAPALEVGAPLFAAEVNDDIAAAGPAWSPLDDRVLYGRYDTSPATIDLGRADASEVGSPIVTVTLAAGIDWLPDGSGFTFSDHDSLLESANLYEYRFDDGRFIELTLFRDAFALWPSVSPDGRSVVYGYSPVALDEATSVELHVFSLDTGEDRLLVSNGLNPDWSP